MTEKIYQIVYNDKITFRLYDWSLQIKDPEYGEIIILPYGDDILLLSYGELPPDFDQDEYIAKYIIYHPYIIPS